MKTPIILAAAVAVIAGSAVWYSSVKAPDVMIIENNRAVTQLTPAPTAPPQARHQQPRQALPLNPVTAEEDLSAEERQQRENDAKLAADEDAMYAADQVIDEVQLQQWFPDLNTEEREFLTMALAQEPELRLAILTAVAEGNGAALGGQAYQAVPASKAQIDLEIQESQREITDLEYLIAEAKKAGIAVEELQGATDRIAELQQTIDELLAQTPVEQAIPKQVDSIAGAKGDARIDE